MGNCAIRAAAAVLGIVAVSACGTSLPKPPTQPFSDVNTDSNYVTLQLFGYDETQAQHFQRVGGRIFLLKYDKNEPQRLIWVNCAAPAVYTYKSGDRIEKEVEFENEEEMRARLGLNVVNLSGGLHKGNKLHVRYRVAGSYEVDPDVKIPRACGDANYYVSLFSVGAYAIDTMGDEGGEVDVAAYGQGGEASSGSNSLAHTQGGDLDACARARTETPVAECSTPLKILLVPIGKDQWSEDAPTSNDPDPTPHPPTDPPSQPPPQPQNPDRQQGTVHAITDLHSPLHKQCHDGLAMSGSAMRDLQNTAERCGRRLGLVPVGQPISNHQAGADPAQQFTVRLEAGNCYRLFGNADASITDLDTKLVDSADGTVVTKDMADDNHPILDPDGPFCVDHSGAYSLVVSTIHGDGQYAIQLWKMPRHD